MAKLFKIIFTILALQVLIGCAVAGTKYSAQEGIADNKAKIVFYRPKEFRGGGIGLTVTEDGEEILHVNNGQFIPYIVDPGTKVYSIKTSGESNQLKLGMEPNQTYYVRLAIRQGAIVNTLYLSRVYEEEALEELDTCCKSGKK